MNSPQHNEPADTSDTLDRVLNDWRVAPARNPQFRAEVWARIGAGAQPWSVYARRHGAMVAGALALAVVVGAVTGRERARAQTAADRAQLASAYVQGLDARSMVQP